METYGNPKAEFPAIAHLAKDGFTTQIKIHNHNLYADEPKRSSGNDIGPDPYGLLTASLGACTAMTIKMYVTRKGWKIPEVTVRLKMIKYIMRIVKTLMTTGVKLTGYNG